MADFYEQPSLERHVKQTLKNIHTFINGEGLKRKRLAKKLGMSESNFSDYLNAKRSNILDFAVRLAEALGLEETYFMNPNYNYQPVEFEDMKAIAFSAGTLSKNGEEGLHQLLRVCELIETYNMEE
ncbi:helix-turn-helix transcriptional regulator [Metabacillus halosaccharovorans]|uniref:helix-turn-helix transcriptional regulator n=1 Tax=Metabacillus halosaccharovorans TaxID=930124 RepID=UPI002041C8EE|nr:helix-turn-helix transcriptional regulator [Metabacillus halosaccharovorans]MCM3443136.1 helix-turn-helix transcriptional regulator [Metabacillus halosaccharovorans]